MPKEIKKKKKVKAVKEAKPKKEKKVKEPEVANVSTCAILDYMNKAADIVEKEENITSTVNDSYRLSTGLFVLDWLLDGGIHSSWYSVAGQEASWKTGSALTIAKSAAEHNVPLVWYMDAENALKSKAIKATFGCKNTSDVFGKRDEKGNYITRPLIRYSDDQRLEKVFVALKKTLLRLPDKQQSPIDNNWYYDFDRTKDDKKKWEAMGLTNPNKKLYSLTGSYWFPAPDNELQFLGVIDSLPALVPAVSAENEEGTDNSIALNARAFSKWIPQVKGLLKRKNAAILVVNQLRSAPMVMYGPTESEPCGQAAKYFSDYRLKFTPRAIPTPAWQRVKGNSNMCEEPSVEGKGNDYYMMKAVKVIKSKSDLAGIEGWVRIWCKDVNGEYRASDLVFDTWFMLSKMNLIQGDRKKKFRIDLKCCNGIEFDWHLFKYCILIEANKDKSLWKKLNSEQKLSFSKPLKIRKELHDIMKKGNLEEYFRKSNLDDLVADEIPEEEEI